MHQPGFDVGWAYIALQKIEADTANIKLKGVCIYCGTVRTQRLKRSQ